MDSARRTILLTFAGCLIVAPAQAKKPWHNYNATAYSVNGETASGAQTREGRTVASDPHVLPLGTKIQVKGAGEYSGVYIVQDSGRKIRGREIDIFMETQAEAKRFGKKPVLVRILELPK